MASDLWQTRLGDAGFAAHVEAALKDMAVVEAANAEEEALAIAHRVAPRRWKRRARPPRW